MKRLLNFDLKIQFQSHTNNCAFLRITCVHPECGMLVKKAELTSHLNNECMYRLEKCKFCQGQIVFFRMKVGCFKNISMTQPILRGGGW